MNNTITIAQLIAYFSALGGILVLILKFREAKLKLKLAENSKKEIENSKKIQEDNYISTVSTLLKKHSEDIENILINQTKINELQFQNEKILVDEFQKQGKEHFEAVKKLGEHFDKMNENVKMLSNSYNKLDNKMDKHLQAHAQPMLIQQHYQNAHNFDKNDKILNNNYTEQ